MIKYVLHGSMFVEWRRDEKRTDQDRRGAECEIPEPRNGGAGAAGRCGR